MKKRYTTYLVIAILLLACVTGGILFARSFGGRDDAAAASETEAGETEGESDSPGSTDDVSDGNSDSLADEEAEEAQETSPALEQSGEAADLGEEEIEWGSADDDEAAALQEEYESIVEEDVTFTIVP